MDVRFEGLEFDVNFAADLGVSSREEKSDADRAALIESASDEFRGTGRGSAFLPASLVIGVLAGVALTSKTGRFLRRDETGLASSPNNSKVGIMHRSAANNPTGRAFFDIGLFRF